MFVNNYFTIRLRLMPHYIILLHYNFVDFTMYILYYNEYDSMFRNKTFLEV